MKKFIIYTLFAMTSMGMLSVSAKAQLITFDDVSVDASGFVALGNYMGYNWTNFYVETNLGDGYTTGIVSPSKAAFNGFGTDASFVTTSGPFRLTSGYFTSAHQDLAVTVTGYRAGSQVGSKSFTTNTAGPALELFNFGNVDTVSISSGGLGNDQVVLDNLQLDSGTAEPEPRFFGVLALGMLGLFLMARRRRNA